MIAIKVGNRWLNPELITSARDEAHAVTVFFGNEGDEKALQFKGDDAKALRQYLEAQVMARLTGGRN